MATNYPGTIQTFQDPSGTSPVATGPDHATLHATHNDTSEAIQAKLGFGASLPTANQILVGQTGSVSTWGTVWNHAVLGSPRITGGTANNLIGTTPTFVGGTYTAPILTNPTISLTGGTTGDIFYRNSGGSVSRLGAGSNGQYLTLSAGLPAWGNVSSGINALESRNGTQVQITAGTMVVGWGNVMVAAGTNQGFATVSFGSVTFASAPYVVPQLAGFTTGTALTSQTVYTTSLAAVGLTQAFGLHEVTTTGFKVSLFTSGNAGGNVNYGFMYIAVGAI